MPIFSTPLIVYAVLLTATITCLPVTVYAVPPFSAPTATNRNQKVIAEKLNQEGEQLREKSRYQDALSKFWQASAIRRGMGDRAGESVTLTNIGLVYDSLGKYPEALEILQQALMITQEIGDRTWEGATLNTIGAVYYSLGQDLRALEIYQRALAIRREVGDRAGVGNSLNNIGLAYNRLEQYPKALEAYQQALVIRREVNDRAGEGATLNGIGAVYRSLEQYSKALEAYQQALVIRREVNDRAGEGATLNGLGAVYRKLKQYSKAMGTYQQALTIRRETGNRAGEGATLSNIGVLLQEQNQSELAIVFFKQSVNVIELIRQDIRALPKAQQDGYTKTVAFTYRHLADLLLQQDRVLEAQQVLELLKVQELDNYLQTVRGTGQPLYELPPEQAILKKYNELQASAIQLGQDLTSLRQIPTANRTSTQRGRIKTLVQLQNELNQQFNQFTTRADVVALVKQLTPAVLRQTVDLAQLDGLRNDLRQLNAVLLYPLVLDDRLELILTTPDSPPLRRTVYVKRTELNAAIANFRSVLHDPSRDAKPAAQKLYTWLIKPLKKELQQARAQTIIYAPDAQLRYIPLQALHDGQQWLVQGYRVNNITAQSFTEFKTQPAKQLRILAGAFASGQFQFQVGDRTVPFAGLPFAGKEVETLAARMPNTTKLIDRAFSRDTTTTQMNEFSVVHLATHANFVPGTPIDSFIVFGNGDRATLQDIGSWSLNNVDLVVLSACETGLGNSLGNGEEILGLGYQFQSRGAKAVIASLWAVDDGGTQALMSTFYDQLKHGNITKAEALRQAQLTLINANHQSSSSSKRSSIEIELLSTGVSQTTLNRLSHPYYWAPFILFGNGL